MNLETLKDFQAFIGEVLESETEKKLDGIRPITHGLGLESPVTSTKPEEPKVDVHTPKRVASPPRIQKPNPTPPPVPRQEVAPFLSPEPASKTFTAPPPLPSVSWVKRSASLFLDQVFVQTLWIIALVITSNIFSGFETGLSSGVFRSFSEPMFFRFAVLEFATIWLAYLAIGLGIFNMTFGMWVWEIRISYGNQKDENYGLRKLMRILWSFIFYAPILPCCLLLFRKNDRNLVDVLSGSNLYLD